MRKEVTKQTVEKNPHLDPNNKGLECLLGDSDSWRIGFFTSATSAEQYFEDDGNLQNRFSLSMGKAPKDFNQKEKTIEEVLVDNSCNEVIEKPIYVKKVKATFDKDDVKMESTLVDNLFKGFKKSAKKIQRHNDSEFLPFPYIENNNDNF